MSKIICESVEKKYNPNVCAVKNFSLQVEDNEFIVLLGPSGCGKSTVLRMIAGLEEATEGVILIDDKTIKEIPLKERDVSMVFQNYALYPHLTVYDNIAFSLKTRKLDKSIIDNKVRSIANKLRIESLLNRKPKTLSGGEKQRVAMGRAIAKEPNLLLMDEPLSNLDAQLRNKMRREIELLYNELKPTVIYVTHDQEEAMALATRIVVMEKGEIRQIGSPREIYQKPANTFVAQFIGNPGMNLIRLNITDEEVVEIESSGRCTYLEKTMGEFLRKKGYAGRKIILGIRGEDIVLKPGNRFKASGVKVLENIGIFILIFMVRNYV